MEAIGQSPGNKMQGILSKRKRIIHRYFDELNQSYVQAHNKDWKDLNIRGKTSLRIKSRVF